MDEQLKNAFNFAYTAIDHAQEINKRLTKTISVIVVSLALCMTITASLVSYFYFCTDYSYPQINQTQSNNSSIKLKSGDK